MRAYSRYEVNPESPRAKAVCDRCGQTWQHVQLRWQFDWIGPRLQNLRFLVCPECYDKPQPNVRTIVIPADPIPIQNPRPENYTLDNSPLSAIGVSANFSTPQYGSRIGNLTLGGGTNSAFDGIINKYSWVSACNSGVSNSSFINYVGINWSGDVANLSMPSSLLPPVVSHTLAAVSIYAPIDRSFLAASPTNYVVQSSPVDTSVYGSWTTIASGTTQGIAGESISITMTSTYTNTKSQFHRVAFQGDATNYVSIAQVQFSVAER